MYILGISCYFHDSAAVLLKDGIVIAAAEEERFSRIKHDASFPKHAIAFCLKRAQITSVDLSYVVFYEKPFEKFERIFLNSLAFAPKTLSLFSASMKEWFFDKLWIKARIASELGISTQKILFSGHHLSHAASAFFCSPFNKSAILTIDGVGEWTTTAWGVGNGNNLQLKEELRFPHSLGLLYSVFTVFCGFEANEGEYKVMGLAPYGTPRYVDKIYTLITRQSDGSFSLNLEYFSYPYSLKGVYTKKFLSLFGEPNKSPEEVTPYYADIAASIQVVLEEMIIAICRYVHDQTHLDVLCFAGGVALNSAANWKILQHTQFKQLYIQPAAGDSGGALGAALWAYHMLLGNKRNYVMKHVYYGDPIEEDQIQQFLKSHNISYKKLSDDALIERVVAALKKGKVVGWVQGGFEWGPRALGHRSILADPRKKAMKDIVNRKIKFREGFRPFAPVTTIEAAQDYFSIKNKKNHYPFRFMLYVVPVKENKKNELEAITHVDGTARPQFVDKKTNPLYHQLITAFGKQTGTPVLLNTSFNLKGEPIVNTSQEAFSTFQRSGIDLLVLGNYLVSK